MCYPWHPWAGRLVLVATTFTRAGRTMLRCRLTDEDRGPPLELPDWMFDRAVCGRMRLAPTPAVSTDHLLALRALLRGLGAATGDRVQERHRPTRPPGDADATPAPPEARPAGPVHPRRPARPGRLAGYHCPSRRPAVATIPGTDQHATYNGGGWAWGKTDYAANQRLISHRPMCRSFAAATDGLSNTALVGEKAMSPTYYAQAGWYWDEPYFAGGSDSTARKGVEVLRDSKGMDDRLTFRENWGAAHPSSTNFLFADGSVRGVAHGTAPNRVKALLTPAGGEVVAGD